MKPHCYTFFPEEEFTVATRCADWRKSYLSGASRGLNDALRRLALAKRDNGSEGTNRIDRDTVNQHASIFSRIGSRSRTVGHPEFAVFRRGHSRGGLQIWLDELSRIRPPDQYRLLQLVFLSDVDISTTRSRQCPSYILLESEMSSFWGLI